MKTKAAVRSALGSFVGRADDVINLRGIKLLPSQIEGAIRDCPGTGDDFEIVLATNADGLDLMTVRVEHPIQSEFAAVAERLAADIRSRCEIRTSIEVVSPGSLPKTEFKAQRVRDHRDKSRS